METIKTVAQFCLEAVCYTLFLVASWLLCIGIANAQEAQKPVVFPMVETHIVAEAGKPAVTKLNCLTFKHGTRTVTVCTQNN